MSVSKNPEFQYAGCAAICAYTTMQLCFMPCKADFLCFLCLFSTMQFNQLDDKADKRVDLIYQMLENIQQKLQTSEASIRIFHGSVKQAFETLTSEYDLKKVFCNRDYEPLRFAT